jgi:hypothetical protein
LKIHFQPVDLGSEILYPLRLLLPNGLRASGNPTRRGDAFPASDDEDVPVVDVDRLSVVSPASIDPRFNRDK